MTYKEKTFIQSWKEPYSILVTLIIGSVIAFLIANLTILHYPDDYEMLAILLMVPIISVNIVRFLP